MTSSAKQKPICFHVWVNPIVQSNWENSACAFTQLALRYAQWLAEVKNTSRSKVILYSTGQAPKLPNVEICNIIPKEDYKDVDPISDHGWWLSWCAMDRETRVPRFIDNMQEEVKKCTYTRQRDVLRTRYTRVFWQTCQNIKTRANMDHVVLDFYSVGDCLSFTQKYNSILHELNKRALVVTPCDRGGFSPRRVSIPIYPTQYCRDMKVLESDRNREAKISDQDKAMLNSDRFCRETTLVCPPAFPKLYNNETDAMTKYELDKFIANFDTDYFYHCDIDSSRSDRILSKLIQQRVRPFLYLARIQEIKGITCFLRLAQLFPEYPFWVGGQPLFMDDDIVEYDNVSIKKCNYSNVRWLGFVSAEKRRRIMLQCCALVQPSQYNDPCPFNIIEAYSCGLPVITSDRGALKEMVVNEVTGYRVMFPYIHDQTQVFQLEHESNTIGEIKVSTHEREYYRAVLDNVQQLLPRECLREYLKYQSNTILPRWMAIVRQQLAIQLHKSIDANAYVSPFMGKLGRESRLIDGDSNALSLSKNDVNRLLKDKKQESRLNKKTSSKQTNAIQQKNSYRKQHNRQFHQIQQPRARKF